MSWLSRISISLFLASSLLLSTPAYADTDGLHDALALEFKSAGDQAMDAQHYEQALDAYDRAIELEAHPSLLFNRGRALQALHRYPEALAAILAFSEVASPKLAAKAGNLAELLSTLRQSVSSLEVTCTVRGAQVVLAGKSLGSTPLTEPVPVNAGSSHLVITADGYLPFETDVVLPPAGRIKVAAVLLRKSTDGHLTVTSILGAVAFADGVRLGTVPAEVTLSSGRHRIRVEHTGFLTSETGVEIAADRHRTLNLVLEKEPSLFGRWWFWTGTGLIVSAGVTALICATTERSPSSGDIPPGRVAAPLLRF
ncbi:MAG TPA: PEGA domain-containing protein [Polyangiaceae bacterium]|nr:PEGA domain-containing protein [Polyangiaceae bacterium]